MGLVDPGGHGSKHIWGWRRGRQCVSGGAEMLCVGQTSSDRELVWPQATGFGTPEASGSSQAKQPVKDVTECEDSGQRGRGRGWEGVQRQVETEMVVLQRERPRVGRSSLFGTQL